MFIKSDKLFLFLTNQEQAFSARLCFCIFLIILCFSLLFGIFCLRAVPQPKTVEGWHVPLVESWVTKGFWRTGGLTIYQGKADPNEHYLYKTSSPVAYYPMYIVQKVIHTVRGKTSMTFWRMHNISLWILSGSLIGFVTFLLLTNGFVLDLRYRSILSFCSSAVYMAHPMVYAATIMMNYDHITTMILIPILVAVTLYAHLSHTDERIHTKYIIVLVAALTAINPPTAALYIASIIGFNVVSGVTLKDLRLKEYILPFIAVFILIKMHMLLGQYLLDVTGTVGSGFRFRSGLDGARDYMTGGYWSIFYDRIQWPGPHSIRWAGYFFLGSTALALSLFVASRTAQMNLYCSQVLPLAMLVVLYFFVFAQGAVIHPYQYDILIVILFTFSIFGWGGGWLLQWARVKGVLAYFVVAVSIVFVMMHLRLYALDNPSPVHNWFPNTATLSPI